MTAYGGRKLAVTLLGALLGLCLALLLQQSGLLPLDRVATFGIPAVVGAAALMMLVVRTTFARTITEWVAITIVVVLVVVAATGVPTLAASETRGGSSGWLSGGCTVEAVSDVDATVVTDTSRTDPFDIDPAGTVSWVATSPAAIMDHTWDVWVDVAGFPLPLADGGDDNADGDTVNEGSEPVGPYADDVGSVIGGDPVGIYLVGGSIAGSGGACEGQAWVRLPGGAFENVVGQGAGGLALVLTVLIIVLVVRVQRTVIETVTTTSAVAGGHVGGGPGSGPGPDGPGDGGPGSGSPLDDIGGGSG